MKDKKYYVVLYCNIDNPSEVIGLYENLDKAKELAEKKFTGGFSWTEVQGIYMNHYLSLNDRPKDFCWYGGKWRKEDR